MKFTQSWLKKFLDTNANIQELSDELTDLGIETEKIIDRTEELSPFITAEITAIRKHPNADKLNLCTVNYGHGTDEIVCGASNVRTGLKVVLAPLGAMIPNTDIKIEKRKIRGIESVGMLCSASELGLSDDSDGILELDEATPVGKKFINVWPELSDPLIEVEVTPNRSDCLGVYGIARDLAASGIGKLKALGVSVSNAKTDGSIVIEDKKKCPLFIARYFSGISNIDSDKELQSMLKSIGEMPISAPVDVTNYINYSFGRPMHVYDADRLSGKLRVAVLDTPAQFVALDGKTYELVKGDLVVRDDKKICGLAGIIGGEDTKCTETTKNIVLEAAVFDHIAIAKTARRLNIETRSKYVFERGVDQDFTITAIELASQMIMKLCGGKIGDTKISGDLYAKEVTLKFDTDKVRKLIGIEFKQGQIIDILKRLGFSVKKASGSVVEVTAPSWRHDVAIEEDLVEEVARIHKFWNIEDKKLPVSGNVYSGLVGTKDSLISSVRSLLAFSGYDELITWSFMSSEVAKKFGSYDEGMLLANPISEELDLMRGSILPNILDTVQKNNSRSIENTAFFEIGSIYGHKFEHRETMAVSGMLSGYNNKRNIYSDYRAVDFFDAKRAVLDIANIFGVDEEDLEFNSNKIPSWYHPGKSAVVTLGKKVIAHLGEFHPTLLKTMKISKPSVGFEVFLDSLLDYDKSENDGFISEYQPVSRDFAFMLDSSVKASDLVRGVKNLDNRLIRNISIFDVYEGDKIDEDKKSIALNVVLQSDKSTLTDNEINNISDRIVSFVKKKLGGEIRSS